MPRDHAVKRQQGATDELMNKQQAGVADTRIVRTLVVPDGMTTVGTADNVVSKFISVNARRPSAWVDVESRNSWPRMLNTGGGSRLLMI